jgi:hypothetical protein
VRAGDRVQVVHVVMDDKAAAMFLTANFTP